MRHGSTPLRLAPRRPGWAGRPDSARAVGSPDDSRRADRSEALLLAGAILALALIARFVPAGRPLLVVPVGLAAFVFGRRSFHLGAAFYLLMLPFLDLLPRQIFGIPTLNSRNLMLLALLSLLLFRHRRPSSGEYRPAGGAVFSLAIAVFAWLLFAAVIAYQRHSIPLSKSLDYWINMAAVVVPLFLGAAAARQGLRPRRFLACTLLAAAFLVSTWALIGHVSKVAGGADPMRLRSAGMLGQPNSFGAFLALAIPGFVTLAAGSFPKRLRLLGLGGTFVCLACLANALSRGSMIAAAAGLVVLGLLRHRVILATMIALAVFAGPLLVPANVSERFSDTFEGKDTTDGLDKSAFTRIEMYRAAPQVFQAAPLLGHGLGAYASAAYRVGGQSLARSPHSWYIQVATEFGLVGILLFGAWTVACFAALWRQRNSSSPFDRAVGNALFASTVALAFVCFFQKPFVDNELILPLYFAGVGLAVGVSVPDQRGASAGPRSLAAIPKE